MPKYYAKYRCLNCGTLFVAGQGAEVPREALTQLMENAIKYSGFSGNLKDMAPPKHYIHFCDGRGGHRIGKGVFAGFGQ